MITREAIVDYSQSGEARVVTNILIKLDVSPGWVVDVGAWDGMELSNTRHLVESRGYRGVFIEADHGRAGDLGRNMLPGMVAMERRVGWSGPDRLDAILGETPVPRDYAALSIDVDGVDYHIWQAHGYRPSVVVIEYNPTIPDQVEFIQTADYGVSHGSSLRSLVKLGEYLGYELVHVTTYNAVFVVRERFEELGISDNRLETLHSDHTNETYVFFGYDGTVFVRGHGRSPWSDRVLKESDFNGH